MEYQNPGVRWRDNCGAVSAGHVLIGSSAKVLGTTLPARNVERLAWSFVVVSREVGSSINSGAP